MKLVQNFVCLKVMECAVDNVRLVRLSQFTRVVVMIVTHSEAEHFKAFAPIDGVSNAQKRATRDNHSSLSGQSPNCRFDQNDGRFSFTCADLAQQSLSRTFFLVPQFFQHRKHLTVARIVSLWPVRGDFIIDNLTVNFMFYFFFGSLKFMPLFGINFRNKFSFVLKNDFIKNVFTFPSFCPKQNFILF